MEVVLHTKELCFVDMRVEERDGASLKVALFLITILVGVQRVVESITLFIKLHRVMRVDFLVVEIESCVLEIWMDLRTCFQIDRSLIRTKTFPFMEVKWIGGVVVFRSIFEALKKERNSWSFSSWIFVRFRIIVLELMVMQVLAVRGTEERSDRLPGISLSGLDLVINFVHFDMFFLPR